jgi:hypothetical protein
MQVFQQGTIYAHMNASHGGIFDQEIAAQVNRRADVQQIGQNHYEDRVRIIRLQAQAERIVNFPQNAQQPPLIPQAIVNLHPQVQAAAQALPQNPVRVNPPPRQADGLANAQLRRIVVDTSHPPPNPVINQRPWGQATGYAYVQQNPPQVPVRTHQPQRLPCGYANPEFNRQINTGNQAQVAIAEDNTGGTALGRGVVRYDFVTTLGSRRY